MATTTIPWGDGSGDNIYLTYSSASGDQTVTVSSDANTGSARTQTVTFTSGVGSITQLLTVNQAAGTTTIPYIRGGADGSYIDTGITPDNTTRVIIWARNFNPTADKNTEFFGSQVASDSNAFVVYTRMDASSGRIGIRFGNSGTVSISDAWIYFSHYHKYELGPDGFLVDDTVISSVTQSSFSSNNSIHLFGMNSNGVHSAAGYPIDLCACKVYKGGVLVRDFTAVNTPSAGLYDAISGTLFTNAGSGSFVYGTFDPTAYAPLEYIGLSGSQWFDSGIKGSRDVGIICCFSPTGTENRYYIPVMSHISTSSGRCGFSVSSANASKINGRLQAALNTSSGFAYNSSSLTGSKITTVKKANVFSFYRNNASLGSYTGSTSSFSNGLNMFVGANNANGTANLSQSFVGKMYYLGFNGEKNFVPALVNNVAGFYDTYNDVFYSSVSETAFTAGPEL